VVSLHVKLTGESRGLIGAEQVRRMKPGAMLINTARGPVVDTTALVEALNSGHLGGAGIDVFDNEPIPAGHPLLGCEQVVLSPHNADQTPEGWDLLKVHPGLTRPEYDAMARTARELGIRFGGHVPEEVGLMHAIEMGQETFDHLDGYVEALNGDAGPVDEARLADVVRRTREAGAWVVPTMALWEVLYGMASLDSLRDAYARLETATFELAEAMYATPEG
jgi:hypothetical protein